MRLRKSIDAMCRQCVYDPYQLGGWRQQVEACGCSNCPLYPVRPRPRRKNQAQAAEGKMTATEPAGVSL